MSALCHERTQAPQQSSDEQSVCMTRKQGRERSIHIARLSHRQRVNCQSQIARCGLDVPSGFALVLLWLAQKWNQRCRKLAPLGSKNPGQHLTKEQQKACLEMAAAELIREITQGRSLN